MKYLSIDLETTGLDPDKDQILSIALVWETGDNTPVADLPSKHWYLDHERLSGHCYALNMNHEIIQALVTKQLPPETDLISPTELNHAILSWLDELEPDRPDPIILAGKNVAGFEVPFLRAANVSRFWHYRMLDPGSMYVEASDSAMPSLKQCIKRAGLDPFQYGKEHDALRDARMVIECVRQKWNT